MKEVVTKPGLEDSRDRLTIWLTALPGLQMETSQRSIKAHLPTLRDAPFPRSTKAQPWIGSTVPCGSFRLSKIPPIRK